MKRFHKGPLVPRGLWTAALGSDKAMKSKKQKIISSYLISFLLGCAVYYVFLCFTGVVAAFLMDIGADSLIFHNLIKPLSSGNLRHLAFTIYFNFKYITVSLVILFLGTYFLSKYLSDRLLFNSLFLTCGALATDLFYFQKYQFESSYLFVSRYMIDIFHVVVWFLCAIGVIHLGRILKART